LRVGTELMGAAFISARAPASSGILANGSHCVASSNPCAARRVVGRGARGRGRE